MNIISTKDILYFFSAVAGSCLTLITRRRGVEIVTTTLAIPGVAFAATAVNDVVKGNHDEDSVGVVEAALSIGGSLCLGYMTGRCATESLLNSAPFLGAYWFGKQVIKSYQIYHQDENNIQLGRSNRLKT